MSEISLMSKTTWNLNALTKQERVRLYDALAQSSTREEREAVLRRTIHFPYSMFSNLIKSVNDVFEKNECPPANHKNECYKELKHVLNDFQQDLNDKRMISDSGEPVRFTLKRTFKPTTHPNPLQPLNSNYIYWLPEWKLKWFAQMISEQKTVEQKKRFIEKYVHVTDEDGNPYDGLLNDIIADILLKSNNNDDLTTESKIEIIFEHLLDLKNTTYPELIHVLYPFPAVYPDIFRNKRRIPTVRKLGGGGKRGGMRRRNQRTKKARKLR
jgi:hypothetical protein